MDQMNTTDYLQSGKSFEDLTTEFGINARFSESGDRVTLNYDQIDSHKHKYHPIVRECRALTLDTASLKVVGRAFPRFFNLGESQADDAAFDWGDFECVQKVDGSLGVLYSYGGRLCVNTRGSFGQGKVNPALSDITWEELFWSTEIDREYAASLLRDDISLVFEICSLVNHVVARHPTPKLVLLSAFWNEGGREFQSWRCDAMATQLRVERPQVYPVKNTDDIKSLMEKCDDPTFEGFVVRDRHGNRLKMKRPEYVALSHLKANGNICLPKNLLTLVFSNELDEAVTHFPEIQPYADAVTREVDKAKAIAEDVYAQVSHIEDQKQFAQRLLTSIPKSHSWMASLFFNARKSSLTIQESWSMFGKGLMTKAYDNGCLAS